MALPAVRTDRRRGFALIAVLWGVMILAVISLAVMRLGKTDAKLASNAVAGAEAAALAEAGINRAALALSSDDFDDRWRADGRRYDWGFGDGRVSISIIDEAGKIDLNFAEVELLESLFRSLGVEDARAAALADAVEDFRDEDNLKSLNGAEDRDYRAAGYAHGAKDDPFEHVSELRQVFGMTSELFALLVPLVTTYSESASVDIWTAPAAVLRAIPELDRDELDRFLARRIEAVTEAELDAIPLPLGSAAEDFIDPGSGGFAFSVRAKAESGSGAIFVREAVILLGDGPEGAFSVAEWHQGERQPSP